MKTHKKFPAKFGDVANFCETYGIDVPASRACQYHLLLWQGLNVLF